MDKLVAQYSRPQHQNEFYSEQEQQDLTESVPPLSLKFALPPVDNVSLITLSIKALELGQIPGTGDCLARSFVQAEPVSQQCGNWSSSKRISSTEGPELIICFALFSTPPSSVL